MNMAKLPTDILVAKGASVLAKVNFYFLSYYSFFLLTSTNFLFFLQGFKFALTMERQLLTLREAYIGVQAKLEDAQQELAQTQQSVAPLLQAARESEEGRQATLVDMRRLERCLDTETVRSLCRLEERECLKREKKLLQTCSSHNCF